MSVALGHAPPATVADLLALPEKPAAELVNGEIVYKASPLFEHGDCQLEVGGTLRSRFRLPSSGNPGWWLGSEVDIEVGPNDVYRPDLGGWRRDLHPERPTGFPVRTRPDWICEILSPSTAHVDLGPKLFGYAHAGVPHYWVVNLEFRVLTVFRLTSEGYVVALTTGPSADVRLPPFDAEPLDIRSFFGIEPAPG